MILGARYLDKSENLSNLINLENIINLSNPFFRNNWQLVQPNLIRLQSEERLEEISMWFKPYRCTG